MKFLIIFAVIYTVFGNNVEKNKNTIITRFGPWAQEEPKDGKNYFKSNDDPNSGSPEFGSSFPKSSIPKVKRYKPEWSDLDTRPLPEWYDQAKIGIFLHWGVYSVPGYNSEWFWINLADGSKDITQFMQKNYPPGFTYQQFAPSFTAEFFDPKQWAELFKKAGAKYVVLTSKHHEGFTLFPSKQTFSWNSVDVGPHRDLVKDLAEAVRIAGLEFGVYHSLFEWFNPLYLKDKSKKFSTNDFVRNKLRPDIEQLVNDYHPSVIWSDGDWETYDTYWNSTDILAWLYNDSPVKDRIVVNDRWGIGTAGKHGDFYNVADRYNPGVLQHHKWENAFTIDKKSWGFRRNLMLSDLLTIEEILGNVVSTVSCGGNALINVGPTKEGTIVPIFQERLLALGEWLEINGEAIYYSSPWLHQNDSSNGKIWYTCTKEQLNTINPVAPASQTDDVTAIYAIFLEWPKNNVLKAKDITPILGDSNYKIEMLGQGSSPLEFTVKGGETLIHLPNKASVKSKHAWTLKFYGSED